MILVIKIVSIICYYFLQLFELNINPIPIKRIMLGAKK